MRILMGPRRSISVVVEFDAVCVISAMIEELIRGSELRRPSLPRRDIWAFWVREKMICKPSVYFGNLAEGSTIYESRIHDLRQQENIRKRGHRPLKIPGARERMFHIIVTLTLRVPKMDAVSRNCHAR